MSLHNPTVKQINDLKALIKDNGISHTAVSSMVHLLKKEEANAINSSVDPLSSQAIYILETLEYASAATALLGMVGKSQIPLLAEALAFGFSPRLFPGLAGRSIAQNHQNFCGNDPPVEAGGR